MIPGNRSEEAGEVMQEGEAKTRLLPLSTAVHAPSIFEKQVDASRCYPHEGQEAEAGVRAGGLLGIREGPECEMQATQSLEVDTAHRKSV